MNQPIPGTARSMLAPVLHEVAHWTGAAGRLGRPAVVYMAKGVVPYYDDRNQEEAVAMLAEIKLAKYFGVLTDGYEIYLAANLTVNPPINLEAAVVAADMVAKYIIAAYESAKNKIVDSSEQAA